MMAVCARCPNVARVVDELVPDQIKLEFDWFVGEHGNDLEWINLPTATAKRLAYEILLTIAQREEERK